MHRSSLKLPSLVCLMLPSYNLKFSFFFPDSYEFLKKRHIARRQPFRSIRRRKSIGEGTQPNREDGLRIRLAVQMNGAAHMLHEPLRNRQAEPAAFE